MTYWIFRENQQLLRQRYYYATWKADGTRYMMLITWDGCYLIDRRFHFRRVQMRFPCRYSNKVSVHFHICHMECALLDVRCFCKWLSPLCIIILSKVIPEKTHHFTLLDGEMIIDTDPNTQKQERRYLIYDVMSINQASVVKVSEELESVLLAPPFTFDLDCLFPTSWLQGGIYIFIYVLI